MPSSAYLGTSTTTQDDCCGHLICTRVGLIFWRVIC